jgi:phosphatidylserine decarboxylase
MKHSGKALQAAFRLILIALVVAVVIAAIGGVALPKGSVSAAWYGGVGGLWVLFTLFTLYFFRDPEARVPAGAKLVLAPGHGKVDVIGTTTEPTFMGGDCQRISIFLSVFDVHVQNAPASGKLAYLKHTAGQFLNALKAESAVHNENVLLGFEVSDPPGQKIGVRLIAGLIARRIVPFAQQGESVERGERISLIQFGSRADVYLPRNARIKVQLNDHVVGGETVLAELE